MPKRNWPLADGPECHCLNIGIAIRVYWAVWFCGHRKNLKPSLLSLRGQPIPVLNAKLPGLGQSTRFLWETTSHSDGSESHFNDAKPLNVLSLWAGQQHCWRSSIPPSPERIPVVLLVQHALGWSFTAENQHDLVSCQFPSFTSSHWQWLAVPVIAGKQRRLGQQTRRACEEAERGSALECSTMADAFPSALVTAHNHNPIQQHMGRGGD